MKGRLVDLGDGTHYYFESILSTFMVSRVEVRPLFLPGIEKLPSPGVMYAILASHRRTVVVLTILAIFSNGDTSNLTPRMGALVKEIWSSYRRERARMVSTKLVGCKRSTDHQRVQSHCQSYQVIIHVLGGGG